MYIIFKTDQGLGLTAIWDDADIAQMLAGGRLPFGEGDQYRVLNQELPLHPLEQWGQIFLDSGQLPDLGEYTAPPVFNPLTRFQFELILEFLGITQAMIFTEIDKLPISDQEKLIAKKKVETGGNDGRWSHSNPLWTQLGPVWGITSEKLDEQWLIAQSIT